ncbi:MAG: alpha-hydroxy-acid oxidizing protein, partial [Promethearchaeota archaeon]
GSFMMAKNNKPVYRKTVEDIKELIAATSLPVIIKGVMTIDDGLAAVEAGASAIVVSNHGGRVLDHTPGTADVLPNIATELKDKIMIIADGGVRTGYDALKMLALGADAVLIGRDIIRAAVGARIDGVRLQMEYLQITLAKAMKMTNCKNLEEITTDILA